MIKNLVGFVTGAATGLGKSVAVNLLNHGMKVVSLDKDFHEDNDINFEKFSSDLNDYSFKTIQENCVFVKGDILSANDVKKAINVCVSNWGKLNVLVNCAGTSTSRLVYNKSKDKVCNIDVFSDAVHNNIVGTFNVIRLAASQMSKNADTDGLRVIINTAGTDATIAGIRGSINAASFGGICSMTLPISRDFSNLKIRLVTVSPGYFKTELTSKMNERELDFLANCNIFPKRIGEPSDFAHCVKTIIENGMINGEVIQLDAGVFIPSFNIND